MKQHNPRDRIPVARTATVPNRVPWSATDYKKILKDQIGRIGSSTQMVGDTVQIGITNFNAFPGNVTLQPGKKELNE